MGINSINTPALASIVVTAILAELPAAQKIPVKALSSREGIAAEKRERWVTSLSHWNVQAVTG
jgi:hypothetical protein